jgi:hypothetical protein
METLQTIKVRKSVRGFKPEQVSEEALTRTVSAANEAPVGMADFGSMHLTVVLNRIFLDAISKAATKGTPREDADIFYGAPTVILVASAPQPASGMDYANAGTVIENMLLAATDLGWTVSTSSASSAGLPMTRLLQARRGFPRASRSYPRRLSDTAQTMPRLFQRLSAASGLIKSITKSVCPSIARGAL